MATSTTPQTQFKTGETVVFKPTGQPKMVVLSCGAEKANCFYYNTITGKFETKDVPLVALKRFVPPTSN